mmetsp:Transcript_3574/g.6669  ORF Transcript_3574/g.6669 Transcript_3574/m.6669 type:complete len:441 (+) Transcript_3574:1-1323(+)
MGNTVNADTCWPAGPALLIFDVLECFGVCHPSSGPFSDDFFRKSPGEQLLVALITMAFWLPICIVLLVLELLFDIFLLFIIGGAMVYEKGGQWCTDCFDCSSEHCFECVESCCSLLVSCFRSCCSLLASCFSDFIKCVVWPCVACSTCVGAWMKRRRDARLAQLAEQERKEKEERERQEIETRRKELLDTVYHRQMDIRDFLHKVAIEFDKSPETLNDTIQTLRGKWVCFLGDLQAYGVERIKKEAIFYPEALEERIIELMTENTGDFTKWVCPRIEYDKKTGVREFLEKIAKANHVEAEGSNAVALASKRLIDQWVTRVELLDKLMSSSDSDELKKVDKMLGEWDILKLKVKQTFETARIKTDRVPIGDKGEPGAPEHNNNNLHEIKIEEPLPSSLPPPYKDNPAMTDELVSGKKNPDEERASISLGNLNDSEVLVNPV